METMDAKADFRVQISNRAWTKIAGWRDATKLECSGLGLVRKKGNIFTIYDAFLPSQECTHGHTELDADAVSQMMYRCHRMNIPLDHIRLWWHTHATFSCFWSGEDDSTADRLAGRAGKYFISIVTNHENKYICRLDMYDPFKVTFDNITLEFLDGAPPRRTNWDYQVAQKVREKTYVPQHIWQNNPKFQGYENYNTFNYNARYYPVEEPDNVCGPVTKPSEDKKEEQLDLPTSDTPPSDTAIGHYEIPKPKWYLEFLERKRKREEARSNITWVNYGGRLIPYDQYLREVGTDADSY